MPNKLQSLRAAPTPSPWPHSGLETEEINIFCDIKIPRSYHITDVDLTQIGTEMIKFRFRHKAPQGGKKHYLLVPFILPQAILFACTATGLEMSVEKRVGA